VCVLDRDAAAVRRARAAGASVARSPNELASRCETVFVCLPTPDVVRKVALDGDGLVAGTSIRTYVDLSTTGTAVASEVAASLAARGIACVDSPVTGGIRGATEGTLAVIVAGAPGTVKRLRPALECFGRIYVVGPQPGQAQTLKLINNLLGAVALAASSEAFVLGAKAGLDPDVMLAVVNAGSGRSAATQEKFPRSILTRRFDHGFPIELYCKDIRLALAEADRLGITMWVGNAARQIYEHARSQDGDGKDFTSVIRTLERWAGVEVVGRKGRARAGRKAVRRAA